MQYKGNTGKGNEYMCKIYPDLYSDNALAKQQNPIQNIEKNLKYMNTEHLQLKKIQTTTKKYSGKFHARKLLTNLFSPTSEENNVC